MIRTMTLGAVALLAAAAARADEGMWLVTAPPLKALQERHSFAPPSGWLEHLQKASVRFPGGSGSFVSADGLVLTNQHVARDALVKLGTKERNIVRDGFSAKARDEELKCLDTELNVLQSIEDVTERVKAAVKPEMSFADAEKARRAVMSAVEKESLEKTGLKSDVVTLYQGGQFHLYRYKKYTDVRLVWAPEADAAHFGGDPDNFEYPRYCLDATFFRVYENGKPAKVEHYLKWSAQGADAGELVFVSGHPGRTSRLNTAAHLELFRDQTYPTMLNLWRRLEVNLKTFSDRNPENARRATGELLRVQNARKLFVGMLAGLQDPQVMETKRSDEKALRAAVDGDAALKGPYGDAWAKVEASLAAQKKLYPPYFLLEGAGRGLGSPRAFNSQLFAIARTIVRHAEENDKPEAERLREFRAGNLASLKQLLFSPAPLYEDLEIVKLADSLALLVEMAGGNSDPVRLVLDGKSPQARASELVRGTKLADVAARKALFEGGKAAVEASDDPMVRLARLVDVQARRVRSLYEEQVEEPQQQAYAKIANALFALRGKDQYPDATFTLRLAYGTVKGYEENGKAIAPWTTLGGAFAHADAHEHKEPFVLPRSWHAAKAKVKAETPYNFVCTADIIGGNSGSPVVNRKGEVVGLIFDGNIQSLVADFQYTETQSRAVAVHSAGIVEALRSVYGATALADELTAK